MEKAYGVLKQMAGVQKVGHLSHVWSDDAPHRPSSEHCRGGGPGYLGYPGMAVSGGCPPAVHRPGLSTAALRGDAAKMGHTWVVAEHCGGDPGSCHNLRATCCLAGPPWVALSDGGAGFKGELASRAVDT